MMYDNNEYYWADSDFVKQDPVFLSSLGLDSNTIEILSEKGFPEWAAPNIYFGICKLNGAFLKIGETRDDEDILLDIKSGRVVLGMGSTIVNSSVALFRESLKAYAVMVEKSININDDSVVENQIPDNLILDFKTTLSNIDGVAVNNNSFWNKEIERCLSHSSD